MKTLKEYTKSMLDNRKMKQYELAPLIKMTEGNTSRFLGRTDARLIDLDMVASALGYDVQLTLIDRQTGQRIECQ